MVLRHRSQAGSPSCASEEQRQLSRQEGAIGLKLFGRGKSCSGSHAEYPSTHHSTSASANLRGLLSWIHEVSTPWQLPSPSPTPSARSSILLILPSRPPHQCPGLPLLLLMLLISPARFIATIWLQLVNTHVCMYPRTFSSVFLCLSSAPSPLVPCARFPLTEWH